MSKQLNYIISAFLLLITISGLLFFILKVPVIISEKENKYWCGTESVVLTDSLILSEKALKGKSLFTSKCASCHLIQKDATGPALANLEERHKWADRNELYKWIKNPAEYMKNDAYTQSLKKQYGSMMTAFGDVITNDEIDAIVEYIRASTKLHALSMPVASLDRRSL